MRMDKKFIMKSSIVVALPLLIGCAEQAGISEKTAANQAQENEIWPRIHSEVKADPAIEAKVSELLATMTLEQKVAQMIQPEIRDISVEDMRRYGFGSYLNGGGAFPNNNKHSTPADWINLAEQMYQASIDDSLDGSTIPTMWGTDAVHGHNNVIGATLFPHNIGLGAANNPELIEKIAQVTATEVMVTGIDWVFAPTVATVRDDRWGRTYEGYSEDPEIVKAYAGAIVKGLQGKAGEDFLGDNRVISTVKHFLGDGGTAGGIDQGNNLASEQELFNIHAQGYVGGLTAGAQSVMASFNSWQGDKVHGNKYLMTDVLKNKMGFDGFVVGDWNGHGQVKGCSNDNCPMAANAGLDIFMVPTDAWKPLMENTIGQVRAGIIPQSRIDDAVARILRVKLRAGLFDKSSPAKRSFSGRTELIGHQDHREVARQAVRESLVLLKNKADILPLSPKLNILVAGDGADNIGKQSGGWSITWQGTNNTNDDFPGGTSIYDGLAEQVKASGGSIALSEDGSYKEKPDVAIVVFGEEPYAEGQGDRDSLEYQAGNKKDQALLRSLKAKGIPVVSVFISGRPMWVNAELNASDAFVAAWLPGSEGLAIADVLLTDASGEVQYDFTGRLSFSWPKSDDQVVNRFDKDYQPLLPYGFGLSYGDSNLLADNLTESGTHQLNAEKSLKIFDRALHASWQASLSSSGKTKAINSNLVSLPGISYRTIDRYVQEDARSLRFEGLGLASFVIQGENVESDAVVKSAHAWLNMELKINLQTEQPVFLETGCLGTCQAKLDISEVIGRLPKDKWHGLSIPLSCLGRQDSKGAFSSLALTTAGKFSMDFYNISLTNNKGPGLDYQCQ